MVPKTLKSPNSCITYSPSASSENASQAFARWHVLVILGCFLRKCCIHPRIEKNADFYTRRQINLYRMFFADFSVNSQPILMKFCKDYFRVWRHLPWNFHQKISCSLKTIVGFTLNSATRIIEFRGFLSQFSTNFHEILHTLFSIHVVILLTSIVEVRPFDM